MPVYWTSRLIIHLLVMLVEARLLTKSRCGVASSVMLLWPISSVFCPLRQCYEHNKSRRIEIWPLLANIYSLHDVERNGSVSSCVAQQLNV